MRGHVSKSRGRYFPVVELGDQQAQRCSSCGRRAGWVADGRLKECVSCGGALEERTERRQRWHEGSRRKKDAVQALTALLGSHDAGTYVALEEEAAARVAKLIFGSEPVR